MYSKIIKTIKTAMIDYERDNYPGKIWKEPITGIIPANDEKLKKLKEAVSAEHLTADDILPDAKSIISFFIPFQEDIVKSNIKGTMASKEWAIAYIKTNDLIKTINDKIEILMGENGYKTGKIPATHNFDVKKLISNWSHRHIAYIAGLGTFGINNMLITKNGCCGRFGSIIINYELNEYKRTDEIIKEKCLHKTNGSCGICQKKCVVNAYENNSYDRHKCYKQCLKNAEYHKKTGYADICGKCLVGLPCSTKEP
jgi:epoxyqueuosine reductase QueG